MDNSAGFEAVRAVSVKMTIFWDRTLYRPLHVNRRFGEIFYGLNFQGRRVRQARNRNKAGSMLHAGFLAGFVFDLEHGSNIFLRNIGWL
jgi:hypothetical protein